MRRHHIGEDSHEDHNQNDAGPERAQSLDADKTEDSGRHGGRRRKPVPVFGRRHLGCRHWTAALTVVNARVEPRIDEIDDEIRDNENRGEQQDQGLRHREVVVVDRQDKPFSDSRSD